ncbi:MAG: radical SAM protein [Acidobacteria bacterium]|nr:radical SAM protein [Acidobacteriota bacterium]MBU4307237.1 radical SAM protein [Acidobacteriota bacterium]MBU4405029.1 radical SAM protein [Acidobacteriota bacterium]MCG2811472.1 radical SAM protein [Candidatus Aminicenantes bacterium]
MNLRKETVVRKVVDAFPRALLGVNIDLTYRCNHNCLHCWLWQPADDPSSAGELTFDEFRRIANEARALGVRDWTISGGEPMLRPDFFDIVEYLTHKSRLFTVKTNGTLVTPRIAQLLARPGETWVSLYGATPEVYERVTRTPGGFERMLRGIAMLKKAGARVVIQAFPMRENWHQWPQMVELARSLSPLWRLGAAWLNFSADGDPSRNAMIAAQRLAPQRVIELDPPFIADEERQRDACRADIKDGDCLLTSCIASRREIHIDPYGGLSICCSIKDPALRYNLRHGTVRQAWEEFVPSLAEKVRGGETYRKQCGSCDLRDHCRWCPIYAYLEHGDPMSKIDYLCDIAQENRRYREKWHVDNRRFFQIGGITIQVDSDLPFRKDTFLPALSAFAIESPGPDKVVVHHSYSLEGVEKDSLGDEVFRQGAWTIFRKGDFWIYRSSTEGRIFTIGVFSSDHSRGRIFHADKDSWLNGSLNSLSLPVTDQILLTRLLAERQGCMLHSAGAVLDGHGFMFVGHSEAGKTTVTRLLEKEAEILCDDRNIVRRQPDGYRLYGTWSHGESPLVSPRSAPLLGVFFLKQAERNCIVRLANAKEIRKRLLACLIRGFVDAAWWNRSLDFIESFSHDVPCFELNFTKQADLASMLRELPK